MAPSAAIQQDKIMCITAEEDSDFQRQNWKRRPHKGESLMEYLSRVRTWKNKPWAEPTLIDRCCGAVAGFTLRRIIECRLIAMGLEARIVTGGLCCCTDVVAHTTNFNTCPSLLAFQETARKGCVRCWYITQAIAKFADRMVGAILSETQVHLLSSPLRNSTGPVHQVRVRWPDTGVRELWQPPKRWFKLDLELYHYKGGYNLFPPSTPRAIKAVRSDDDECFAKIKTWINMCVNEHSCGLNAQESFLPTRLIDIEPGNGHNGLRLVHSCDIAEETAKFAALSHCWGDSLKRIKAIPKTKIATLNQHLDHIDWDGLTETFKDAILVTRRLGLRYIWIDSLCIVQNDKHDFAKEVSRLVSTYGHSFVVLAATRGETGDAGLFHNRPSDDVVSRIDNRSGNVQELRVMEALPHDQFLTSDPHHFQLAPLLARAWCFQERLLGRRVIHFSGEELVFECGEGFYCECKGVNILWKTENFKTKTLSTLRKNISIATRYELWYTVVQPYSTRILTVESDRLPALSGFAQLVSVPEMGRYCAGLWESELPSGLLWRVLRARPGCENVGRPKDFCAPTWSWASVQAVIEGHMRWHTAIEVLTRVEEVQCILATSEDPFGEVAQGYIVLDSPVFEVFLRRSDNEDQQQRSCYISRCKNEMDQRQFDLDVPLVRTGSHGLCVAIERWHSRICDGQVSCLVLEPHATEHSYVRIGTSHCPADWLEGVERRSIRVV